MGDQWGTRRESTAPEACACAETACVMNDGVGVGALEVYDVVDDIRNDTNDDMRQLEYGPEPLKSRFTFSSNSLTVLRLPLSCYSR